jgi:cytoskeletal protein CcmA (bactofilin family)
MFSKDSRNGNGDNKDRVPSIISASLRIVGDLVSEGDVQVDGIIEGDVSARSLTVSEGATVRGQISAQKVIIRGEVQGQISAEAVELGRTARVIGDILHQDLMIESGAFLEGNCRHKEHPALPAAQLGAPEAAGETARVVNG